MKGHRGGSCRQTALLHDHCRGGKLVPLCGGRLVVPSDETPSIQEMHIMMGHILCDMLEDIER